MDKSSERASVSAWESMRHAPFLWLFVFTMAVLLLTPLLLGNRLLMLVMSVVYLQALWVTLEGVGRPARVALWALWAVAVALKVISFRSPDGDALYVASRLCSVVLLVVCVAATMRHVLHETEVTLDSIFAAIVAYVLGALAFAAAYSALYALDPANFSFPAVEKLAEPGAADIQTTYFSFVTIATLGYGDITPRLPFSQMLVVTEAMFGQFYVAVVIAWLVSMSASRPRA